MAADLVSEIFGFLNMALTNPATMLVAALMAFSLSQSFANGLTADKMFWLAMAGVLYYFFKPFASGFATMAKLAAKPTALLVGAGVFIAFSSPDAFDSVIGYALAGFGLYFMAK